MIINYQTTIPKWNGEIISYYDLSSTARKKYHRLRKLNKSFDEQFPPILAEKAGRGHMLFVPFEWNGVVPSELAFKIAMECYANTSGVLKVV